MPTGQPVTRQIRRQLTSRSRNARRSGATSASRADEFSYRFTVAHHFYLIEQGKVTFSGDPGSLAEDEVIRRAYLGSAKA
jgi:ABC-type branched-subunit amino acid transport system ATPase component